MATGSVRGFTSVSKNEAKTGLQSMTAKTIVSVNLTAGLWVVNWYGELAGDTSNQLNGVFRVFDSDNQRYVAAQFFANNGFFPLAQGGTVINLTASKTISLTVIADATRNSVSVSGAINAYRVA